METEPGQSPQHLQATQVDQLVSPEQTTVNTIMVNPLHVVANFFVYKQERIGMDGEPFTMYKFRTMKHGSHAKQDTYQKDARGKVMNDDRFTVIGKWLKQHRVDEMPQLLNVVRGEMSLVGPRPHSQKFNDRYVPVDLVAKRQRVKPGIFKPMMAFSDYDEAGGLEYRCDEQFLADQAQHPHTNVLRYFLRCIAPLRYKRVLDPSLPRYNKKDFYTPRLAKPAVDKAAYNYMMSTTIQP